MGSFLLNFQKREYLIFVRFYKLINMCTLAFLYSIPISTLGLCHPPICCFTHFSCSHTCFP